MPGTVTRQAERVRDAVVAGVSLTMNVPVEQIMRSRTRRPQRASEGRWVAMYVLSHDVDRVGVPELEALFDTTWQTIDGAWRAVAHTPELRGIAGALIRELRDELASLVKVADGRGEE